MTTDPIELRRRIRTLLVVFVIGLVLSGLTAFPLEHELRVLCSVLGIAPASPAASEVGLEHWIATVAVAVHETNLRYPFIAYGTDWLAFAHLVIAVAFIGPILDPVRNAWVVTFGLIACLAVIPFALTAGAIREIPLTWRLIDCSFGVFGAIPLWLARRDIVMLEAVQRGAELQTGFTQGARVGR
jgi:hypothetical protein